jgi:hypothetical protein
MLFFTCMKYASFLNLPKVKSLQWWNISLGLLSRPKILNLLFPFYWRPIHTKVTTAKNGGMQYSQCSDIVCNVFHLVCSCCDITDRITVDRLWPAKWKGIFWHYFYVVHPVVYIKLGVFMPPDNTLILLYIISDWMEYMNRSISLLYWTLHVSVVVDLHEV